MAPKKVTLSTSLKFSKCDTISISNPDKFEPLRLIITLRQKESPFPERPVTLLTQYTFLTREPSDAFTLRLLESPRKIDDPEREIWMYPRGVQVNRRRLAGNPNIREREYFEFISVPAVGEGSAQITFELPPEMMFRRYHPSSSLEERLKLFQPGEHSQINLRDSSMTWWTWGCVDSELQNKKFARWTFPDDLPLDRKTGDDESGDVNHKLSDPIQYDDVNNLFSQTDEPPEERPDVKAMRADGWVFGEPLAGLEVVSEGPAVFSFVE